MSLSTCTRPMVVSAAGQITADNFSVDSRGHGWGNCKWGTRIIGRAAAVKSGTGEQELSPVMPWPCEAPIQNYELSEWCINRMYWRELAKTHLPPIAKMTCSFGDPNLTPSDKERLLRPLDVDRF